MAPKQAKIQLWRVHKYTFCGSILRTKTRSFSYTEMNPTSIDLRSIQVRFEKVFIHTRLDPSQFGFRAPVHTSHSNHFWLKIDLRSTQVRFEKASVHIRLNRSQTRLDQVAMLISSTQLNGNSWNLTLSQNLKAMRLIRSDAIQHFSVLFFVICVSIRGQRLILLSIMFIFGFFTRSMAPFIWMSGMINGFCGGKKIMNPSPSVLKGNRSTTACL